MHLQSVDEISESVSVVRQIKRDNRLTVTINRKNHRKY